jgi:2-isopropylmalate synthase
VIRVNSQSGKGGVAYLLKIDHGLELPRALQVEFSRIVQEWTDRTGKEASSSDIWTMFCQRYLGEGEIDLVEYRTFPDANGRTISATIMDRGDERIIEGHGSGPLDAFVDALRRAGIADIAVLAYHEHAIGAGSDARAAAYVEAVLPDGRTIFGVEMDRDIVSASLRAVTSVAGRARHS